MAILDPITDILNYNATGQPGMGTEQRSKGREDVLKKQFKIAGLPGWAVLGGIGIILTYIITK